MWARGQSLPGPGSKQEWSPMWLLGRKGWNPLGVWKKTNSCFGKQLFLRGLASRRYGGRWLAGDLSKPTAFLVSLSMTGKKANLKLYPNSWRIIMTRPILGWATLCCCCCCYFKPNSAFVTTHWRLVSLIYKYSRTITQLYYPYSLSSHFIKHKHTQERMIPKIARHVHFHPLVREAVQKHRSSRSL